MVARFPNMIGIMNTCIKTSASSCEVPVNSLGLRVLRLFREHSLIYGFSFVSSYKTGHRLYPRVKILFKGSIKMIKIHKNSYSNRSYLESSLRLSMNQLFLVTDPTGISLITLSDFYLKNKHKKTSRILAEIFI